MIRRGFWWLLAWTALVLGLIGIVVPGLPTTPLILLAAFAAARGSPGLARRLHADPRFGPMIADWQQNGAVSRKAKIVATVTMAICAGVLGWFASSSWLHAIPIVIMLVVGCWLWARPEPRMRDG